MSCHNKTKNINFKFKPPLRLYFWLFTKIVLLIVFRPLNVYQSAKFLGPTFSGANLTPISEVGVSAIWNG
jgi:hypothetical protein